MDRLWNLPQGDLPLFILTLFRMSGVVLLAPLFGSGGAPARARRAIAAGMGLLDIGSTAP